ncbi:unnamed protein product [Cyclocybe aegerita]|uniref:Uncharacterized protein n=1 Tax=Cyclocybe aegerita TaxID=1973307 RepID=A0A8S0WI21_CYCAE|nr:unnamed protein product [Cyclocybe aegerita]
MYYQEYQDTRFELAVKQATSLESDLPIRRRADMASPTLTVPEDTQMRLLLFKQCLEYVFNAVDSPDSPVWLVQSLRSGFLRAWTAGLKCSATLRWIHGNGS